MHPAPALGTTPSRRRFIALVGGGAVLAATAPLAGCAGSALPETDPFGRQILIGCGAFIELAVIAAR